MAIVKRFVHAFGHDRCGASSLEFGVISGLIGAGLIGAIKTTAVVLSAMS